MASSPRIYVATMLLALTAGVLAGCNDDPTSTESTTGTVSSTSETGATPTKGSFSAGGTSNAGSSSSSSSATSGAGSVSGTIAPAPGATGGGTATSVASTPIISGTPATSVAAGSAYSFRPSVADAGALALTFAIVNQPSWTTFDPKTGTLSGTPSAANVGMTASVSISVSNGSAGTSMAPFPITVSPAASSAAPHGLSLSGSPATTVATGTAYSFVPTTSDTQGAKLTFSIANKPAWATFNAQTGGLSGTPGSANIGTTAQIAISVSDGTNTEALAPFAINVTQALTSVTLSWMAPTQNTNGTNATDLAGYHIYYGATASALDQVVTVSGAETTKYTVSKIMSGTWFFAVAAFNNDKVESGLSAVVQATL